MDFGIYVWNKNNKKIFSIYFIKFFALFSLRIHVLHSARTCLIQSSFLFIYCLSSTPCSAYCFSVHFTICFHNEPITFKIAWNGRAQFFFSLFLYYLHREIHSNAISKINERKNERTNNRSIVFVWNCLDIVRNKLVFNPIQCISIERIHAA